MRLEEMTSLDLFDDSMALNKMINPDYMEENDMLMETIDALLVDEPSDDMFADTDSFSSGTPVSSPMPSNGSFYDASTSSFFSPRGGFSAEPNCFPADKPLVKRKRSMSHALEFSPFSLGDDSSVAPPCKRQAMTAAAPVALPMNAPVAVPSKLAKRQNPSTDKGRVPTSSYRGVCWYKRTERWVVQIKIKGVRVHIGYYKDEVEAALAYEKAIAKIAVNPDIDRAELRS